MRVATVVLMALVGSAGAYAQQLERPPLVPAQREDTPLFATLPLDQAVQRPPVPAESAPLTWSESQLWPTRPGAPPGAPPRGVPLQRFGAICLKSVPVDASIDPRFVKPVPNTGLAMRMIDMPPCVTHGGQQSR